MPQDLTPGQIIYRARKSKKMSQERLGKLIGLERSAIRDLERGKKNSLTFQQFSTLHREFSLTPNDILGIHPGTNASDEEALSSAIERVAPEISKLILNQSFPKKIK